MCYSIPGKLISFIDHKTAVIDYFVQQKKVYFDIHNLRIGDYIYAQGGYAIKKIPKKSAENILVTWKETFFELQELDFKLSKIKHFNNTKNNILHKLLNKILNNKTVTNNELIYLSEITENEDISLLTKAANYKRQFSISNSCCIHGIIEISNHCINKCKYCGISYFNKNIKRYRMNTKTIYNTIVTSIKKFNFQAFVIQAGEDPGLRIDEIVHLIKELTEKYNILIFISFGEIELNNLKKLYDAGAKGLLMRFETSNKYIYQKMHPGKSLKKRLEYIHKAQEIGYLIITGSLIGLPGQTNKDILSDIKTANFFKPVMYSFGPFIPHKETPLSGSKLLNSSSMLKTIALTRIMNPENANILITSAFETIDKDARIKGLLAGANSLMINLTPEKYRSEYQLYPHRTNDNDCLQKKINQTINFLKSIGRSPTDLGI